MFSFVVALECWLFEIGECCCCVFNSVGTCVSLVWFRAFSMVSLLLFGCMVLLIGLFVCCLGLGLICDLVWYFCGVTDCGF